MGTHLSKQVERRRSVTTEKKTLHNLKQSSGCEFPGSSYTPKDRKNWMKELDDTHIHNLHFNHIVWPGTHNSATNVIGIPLISRPFAQCQSLSIYEQLCLGVRALDIRVQRDRRICHGILETYGVEVVLEDIKRFMSETVGEIVLLEVRTEYGHEDPPGFDEYLVSELGELLIPQDEGVFVKRVVEVLPGRVICVWKPRGSDCPKPKKGSLLWSGEYLVDDWIDTDLPSTKFESNLKCLGEQQTVNKRKYFYRVENTVTPQADNPVVCVWRVTKRIHGYARLFISQCVQKGRVDRLQVFSTDFIDEDFVDACVGLTHARILEQVDE